MAQTGYTPILIYSSSTAAAAPIAGNLTNSTLGSELAINITDGKLFYKDSANAIQVIGWKVVPTTAGGTGLTSYTQGDLLYYNSGTTLTALPKNTTATRYLSNTGTNNNPAWAQIDLSNGVTGTLPVGNGGTGATTFTAGRVLFGNTTSAINTDANLFWDNTNKRLGVGTNAPAYLLHVYNGGGNGQIGLNFGTANNGLIEAFSSGLNLAALGATSYMTFAAGGTSTSEAMRIHASRGVSIGNTTDPGATNLSVSGNVVIATSGKGIDFSATAGTGTSELLADYEEGTWTPTIASNTGTITSYTSSGTYTKTGRLVTLVFTFKITNNGTGAGFIKVTNLPFNVVTGNSAGTGVEFAAVGYQTVAYAATSTQINMFKYDWTYPGGLNHEFYVTISYQN